MGIDDEAVIDKVFDLPKAEKTICHDEAPSGRWPEFVVATEGLELGWINGVKDDTANSGNGLVPCMAWGCMQQKGKMIGQDR